jgi:predicted CoA-binding protein
MTTTLSDIQLKELLQNAKNIAIMGLSDSPEKPSYKVAEYLISVGYNLFPINPKYDTVLGLKCYHSLHDIEETVDIVDIFRRPEHMVNVVQEIIKIGKPAVWMQLGIINPVAAEIAQQADLKVIMDRCIKIEHRRLMR